ncbi:MAG: hypothetical protein BWY74_03454 [Firmicutes bacterium ADurb.Bin419]|nr:MAG: hypothetical protein BWY74_03454 [Firmicutes bacterium ADurb.Bin419]
MRNSAINFENILNIIFKTTTKSAQFFADCYLKKDISIISRWKNNIVVPKIEDLRKIVEFAKSESTGVQRVVIKDEITKLLKSSPIKKDILEIILEKENFEDFLMETLSALSIDYKDIISENNEDNICDQKTQQCKDFKSIDKETHESNHNEEKDVVGNYTGVVQFDLLMLRKKGKKQTEFAGEIKKDIDLSLSAKQGDINKIGKYILNRMTIGIIVLVSISGFLITQAADNGHNKGSKDTYPSEGITPVVTAAVTTPVKSTPIVSKIHTPSESDGNKLNKTPIPTPETLLDDYIIQTQTPILVPAPTPSSSQEIYVSPASKKGQDKSSTTYNKETDHNNSNTNSTNNGVINNFNITFEGNDNDIAVGNSTIIKE